MDSSDLSKNGISWTFFKGFEIELTLFLITGFFVMIGLTLGMLFILVGIWPVFIIAISVTGITIVTLPKNVYYHALVTYRQVNLYLYTILRSRDSPCVFDYCKYQENSYQDMTVVFKPT